MPEIALTGASGHLGYVLHRMLLQQGVSHRMLLRAPVPYISHADIVLGGLENTECLHQLTRGCRAVIHCAALIWPADIPNEEVVRINYKATRQLAEVAMEVGADHFTYISSIRSMDQPGQDTVFNESAPLTSQQRRSYDYSKAMAERMLRSLEGIGVTIVNPTAIIGPGDHKHHGMNLLFRKLLKNSMPMLISGGFNVVDARDVAAAVIRATRNRVQGKFILAGKYMEVRDLALTFGDAAGIGVPARSLPGWMMELTAQLLKPVERLTGRRMLLNSYSVDAVLHIHRQIDTNAAEAALGFSARDIEATMDDMVRWMNGNEIAWR